MRSREKSRESPWKPVNRGIVRNWMSFMGGEEKWYSFQFPQMVHFSFPIDRGDTLDVLRHGEERLSRVYLAKRKAVCPGAYCFSERRDDTGEA